MDLISVTGHDDEKTVLTFFLADEISPFILRFALDTSRPTSLQSRIVNCFFEYQVLQENTTFQDRSKMREAINHAANHIIPKCMADPCKKALDIVVDVTGDGRGTVSYSLCHETTLYEAYLFCLQPLDNILASSQFKDKPFKLVDRASLSIISMSLAGHSTVAFVRNPFDPDPTSDKEAFVIKSQDFIDFLVGPPLCAHTIKAHYNEITTLYAMPPHPNIICPSDIFVTTPSASQPGLQPSIVVCGMLQPFYANGNLDEYLRENTPSLARKATWCFQLVSAIHHAHFVGKTYHMDLKPPNFLLDHNLDLVIIDWENSGANKSILPPEADGSFDVSLCQLPSGAGILEYEKYSGPARLNNLVRPFWNVFPIWNAECPRAVELAQVYSLGRAMWMILTGVLDDELEDADIWWTLEMEKVIPESWRKVVEHCVRKDPNERMDMEKLSWYWQNEVKGENFQHQDPC